MDGFIWAFMHIANCRLCLNYGPSNKGHDSTPLKVKAIAKCWDPRPMSDGLNTKDGALEG